MRGSNRTNLTAVPREFVPAYRRKTQQDLALRLLPDNTGPLVRQRQTRQPMVPLAVLYLVQLLQQVQLEGV